MSYVLSFLIIGFSAVTGVNLMMSHASVIHLLTTFGNDHNKEVSKWRDALRQFLAETRVTN